MEVGETQRPGHGFVQPGSEGLYLIIVPAQVHPVGQQYYNLPQLQVNPKGDPGETQVADAAG